MISVKKYKKEIILISSALVIIFLSAMFLPRNFISGKETIFNVVKGEGSKEIALNLEKEKLISLGPLFRLYVLVSGDSKKLQAGGYRISSLMNIPQIAAKMAKGDTAKAKITIPEGFTSEQIYQKLSAIGNINLIELEEREGYLFPDTYEFAYGMETDDIIKIMTDNFDKKVAPDSKEEIERQGKTLEDIVIMASMLEKEVITYEDKQVVAGVLWKRLRAGMPLQVDATIAYITGNWASITADDKKIDSPYNTYKYRRLPAGPIGNPGLDSIKAAIYPKDSQYWYYLSTPDGKTIFSRTLEEHNIARAKYLK